jgi:squalene synthase HpnC
VGSALIRAELRPCVMRYYTFARAADDVADDPALHPSQKLRRLDAFEDALDGRPGPAEGAALRRALGERGLDDRHARDLLTAFRRDAVEGRCADWAALDRYCEFSARPVGRFMLDLHGEHMSTYTSSDALTAALQVLNHLQDMGPDRARLDRVYLPLDWMAEAGAPVSDLDRPGMTASLAAVMDRVLDRCDAWLEEAAPLPRLVTSARLAGECAAILHLARRLSRRLRGSDPLARRVALGRADFAAAGVRGLGRTLGAAWR